MAYLPLSTANLPDPVIDPAQGASPADHFDIDTYSGTSAAHERSNFTFQPDFLWFKCRNAAESHFLFNVHSGATKYLRTDATGGDTTNSSYLTSFDSDGFTLGTNENINETGETYVSWAWKANGSGVSNTDGDIPTTVSVNTTSGFSIVSYICPATTTTGDTIGHGLGVAPEFAIFRNRDFATDWGVYHKDLGNTHGILLNSTGASFSSTEWWNNTSPTSAVMSLGRFSYIQRNSDNYIAYLFHSVEGFSKFGSYVGNGSTDGPFVYTGFRPSWVMIKRSDSASTNGWYIYDNKRENYGTLVDAMIYANLNNAEDNGSRDLDFTSNGFKPRITDANVNASGGTYIYMAFAENPFKYATAR